MKKTVTIVFEIDSGEDESELKDILNAHNAFMALSEIKEEIFRPARKHGYSDPRMRALTADDHPDPKVASSCIELVSLLEKKFHEILYERNIQI